MKAPQIIWIVLTAINVGYACAKHGDWKNEKYNGPVSLAAGIIMAALLWWGGFFG